MKLVTFLFCLIVLLLLAAPACAESSSISDISPKYGYTGSTVNVTITGSNFNMSSVTAKLMMTGKGNITSSPLTVTPVNSNTIVCKFTLPAETTVGTWSLVVVNQDGSEASPRVDIFSIRAPVTMSSVTPATGRTNNVSTKISVVGTGLSDISSMYLYNSDYSNITASGVSVISSTRVNGTFDLTSKSLDTYKVCLMDSFGTRTCDLSFKITSDAVGSIDVSSSPSGADLYLDGTLKGTTPLTINDLDAGSYKLIVKKDGYIDWMRTAKVTNGATTSFTANLEVKTTAPTTTAATPVPTSAPTTVKTTKKSTITTPTPWPSATPTPASPVGILVVIGAVGLACITLRKH